MIRELVALVRAHVEVLDFKRNHGNRLEMDLFTDLFRDQGHVDFVGCPQCGGHLERKSELGAQQLSVLGSCGVPGSRRQKSELSSYQIALGKSPGTKN